MKKSKTNSKRLNNCIKTGSILLFLGALLLALFTLHDLQTAEGVGLYLAMLCGREERRNFDLLADIVGMLLLLACLLFPCIILKYRRAEAFFHMAALYLAFIPTVSPGSTVHLPDRLQSLSINPAMIEGSLGRAFLESFSNISDIFLMLFPLLLLCLAVNREHKNAPMERWKKGILALEFVLLLLHFLFPTISQEISFIMVYTLVIWIFAELETLCLSYPGFSNWGMILYGGCLLRGIYRMIELMSTTQL